MTLTVSRCLGDSYPCFADAGIMVLLDIVVGHAGPLCLSSKLENPLRLDSSRLPIPDLRPMWRRLPASGAARPVITRAAIDGAGQERIM